jgi:hypothetical protein
MSAVFSQFTFCPALDVNKPETQSPVIQVFVLRREINIFVGIIKFEG